MRGVTSGSHAPLFVDRTREQTILSHALNAAIGGQGGLVLVAGNAGVGKTALTQVLACAARERGAVVLTGRCYEAAHPSPYDLWLNLFASYPDDAPVPPPATFAHPGVLGPVENPAALTRQIVDWFSALSSARPLVLILDDLHWADAASLDFLRVLSRSLVALPALVISTYRVEDLDRDHVFAGLLPRLVREAGATRLALQPLTRPDIDAWVRTQYVLSDSDANRLANYLYRRSDGNAFFTTELLHALEEEGMLRFNGHAWTVSDLARLQVPVLVRQVIDERIARLGRQARELLEVAAVIGMNMPSALWIGAARQAEETVLAVADHAIAAHLLESRDDGTLRFVHALTRDALDAGISFARRRGVHQAVAETLMMRGDADPGVVAMHLRAAGDRRALDWFLRAAGKAEQSFAFKSAIDYLDQAIALLAMETGTAARQAELHLHIILLARFGPWSVSHYLDALRLAREAGDEALEAVAMIRGSVMQMNVAVDFSALIAQQAQALTILESLPTATHANLARVDATAASLPISRQFYAQCIAVAGRFADVFRLLDVPPDEPYVHRPLADGTGYAALGATYDNLGRVADARAAFADCTAWYRRFEQLGTAAAMYEWELNERALTYFADDPSQCKMLADTAEQLYALDPAMPDTFPTRLPYAGLLALTGEWTEALTLIETTRHALGFVGFMGCYYPVLGALRYARGERDEATEVVHTIFPAGAETEPGGVYLQSALSIQRLAAALALDAKEPSTARAWLEAHDRWLAWSGAALGQADGALAWVHYFRETGDHDHAVQAATNARTLASMPRQPRALLAAYRSLGELCTDAGQYRDARNHLETALALADACAAPYERALTLTALIALQCASGEVSTDASDEARAILTRLGALPALARLGTLSVAATPSHTMNGSPSGMSRYDTPFGVPLTQREVQVLALLAQGRTITEVAKALAVSTRTVERHITNSYHKIGARNRADAVAFALRVGLIHDAIH